MITLGMCSFGEGGGGGGVGGSTVALLLPFNENVFGSRLTHLAHNDGSWLDLSPCSVALTGIFFNTIMSTCHRIEEGDEF